MNLHRKNKNFFQIAYIGTLYAGQGHFDFYQSFQKVYRSNKSKNKNYVSGLDLDVIQKKRIEKLMFGYESFYSTSTRIPKSEILKIEKSSHLLLHVAWKGFDGIIASKIYEYIGSGTKVLVVPGDKGSIDKIVTEANCSFIFNNVETTFDFLCNQYEKFKLNEIDESSLSIYSDQFTRENQAKILGKILDKLIN